jgi:hypothetical protein
VSAATANVFLDHFLQMVDNVPVDPRVEHMIA